MKSLFIAEKPSVAREFAKVLGENTKNGDGYIEGKNNIFTWCVGHLVTMSYPEVYDANMAKWRLDTLPFLPKKYKYEVISNVRKQFNIVKNLIFSDKIDKIYVCTDSGREGEYIYRLIEEISGVPKVQRLRVWIDSQTEEEIKKGIANAKDLSYYDNLSASAYLRSKEDYLMGINFSRLLTLSYSKILSENVGKKWLAIAVGRVMTCVLGMIVQRERDIRCFVKTPYYKIVGEFAKDFNSFLAEWKVNPKSVFFNHNKLYKNNGILDKNLADNFAINLKHKDAIVKTVTNKKEKKLAPLLYNLAELQNECAKVFKISPDITLEYIQNMYEKKLITYPRTDARVLSTAISKEIHKNVKGLISLEKYGIFAKEILDTASYKNLAKTKYVDDKKITDHYAIIPTGYGLNALKGLNDISRKIYIKIVERFLSIMYPCAEYNNLKIVISVDKEEFTTSVKTLEKEGYLKVIFEEKKENAIKLPKLKKGDALDIKNIFVKNSETTPPKRYTTGTIILAMENAGSLIEDEELRAQIKGAGIGTSATRAEIIKKLLKNNYIKVDKKTQILTPSFVGECIVQIVLNTIPALLNPKLTASWEKGLNMVASGEIAEEEYMIKLEDFVRSKVSAVKNMVYKNNITNDFKKIRKFY